MNNKSEPGSQIELSEQAKGLKIGIYEHFKGRRYEVLGVTVHSETLEELVLYRVLGEDFLWVRPIDMFLGEKALDNRQKITRFKYLREKK